MATASSSAAMQGGEAVLAPSPFSVAALDIGGTKIAGAVVRYAGEGRPEVLARTSIPTDAARGGADVLARVRQLACKLVQAALS